MRENLIWIGIGVLFVAFLIGREILIDPENLFMPWPEDEWDDGRWQEVREGEPEGKSI